jgi:hypothetical protein
VLRFESCEALARDISTGLRRLSKIPILEVDTGPRRLTKLRLLNKKEVRRSEFRQVSPQDIPEEPDLIL